MIERAQIDSKVLDKSFYVENIKTKLIKNFSELKGQYFEDNQQTDTRFFILDELFDHQVTALMYQNILNIKDGWTYKNTFREKKSGNKDINNFQKVVSDVFHAFQDEDVIKIISEITEIGSLKPDPSLYASGISKIKHKNFLNPHIDNSHDGNNELYRRLNLLFMSALKLT